MRKPKPSYDINIIIIGKNDINLIIFEKMVKIILNTRSYFKEEFIMGITANKVFYIVLYR